MSIKSLYPDTAPSLLLDFANTKRLDPRITFSRASTGRFYDGKTVAKAEENLLTYSEQFDNSAWVKGSVTVSANAVTAPDGTATADTVVHSSTTGDITQNNSIGATTCTCSFFLKYVDVQWVRVLLGSGVNSVRVWFDIQNGVLGANVTEGSATHVASSIVSVGNGWYRCIVTGAITSTSGNFVQLSSASADGNSTRVAGSYSAWGAQLEQRSAVTAYTATTTQPITNYIPALQTAAAGQARFDHNPTTGESLGLLVEEQRTNVCPRSEEFDDAGWLKTNTTLDSEKAISPAGTLTAFVLRETSATATHSVGTNGGFFSVINGTNYSFSVYAKKGIGAGAPSIVQLRTANFVEVRRANFNLDTGQITSETAAGSSTITSVGNGWYRLSLNATAIGTGAGSNNFAVNLTDNNATAGAAPSYAGNTAANVLIWGAQVEAGAFPTSYIPTTSASATRSADAASMTGANFSSWFRQDQGSIYVEALNPNATGVNGRVFNVSDGSQNNEINVYVGAADQVLVRTNGSSNVLIGGGTAANNTFYKIGFGYAVANYGVSLNGGAAGTSTNASLLPQVNQLVIGSRFGGTAFINGPIKKLSYYPSRLSNAQLQALTT
jgi:hypothetical protein